MALFCFLSRSRQQSEQDSSRPGSLFYIDPLPVRKPYPVLRTRRSVYIYILSNIWGERTVTMNYQELEMISEICPKLLQRNQKREYHPPPPNKKTWDSPVKSMFSAARNTMWSQKIKYWQDKGCWCEISAPFSCPKRHRKSYGVFYFPSSTRKTVLKGVRNRRYFFM